jgi:hypothetical protein
MLAGVLAMPAAAGASDRVTVAQFASRLDSARGLVAAQKAGLDTTSAASALADGVDALLPASLSVAEGTRTISVDLSGVVASTREIRAAGTTAGRRAAAGRLATRLDSMRAAVADIPGAAADPSDPAALRDLVAAVPHSSSAGDDWLNAQIQKFLEWVSKLLDSITPSTWGGNAGAARATMVVVLAIPVLLALIVLVRALRTRRRRATAGTGPAAAAPSGTPAVAAAADLPADALGYARRLAAAGEHRDAVRALYGGAARHLVEEGAVSRMRTRTNREMLRDVTASAPAAAVPFEALTGDFERAWYGHADPGADGFERARGAYIRVVGDSGALAEPEGAATAAPDPGPAPATAPAPEPGPAAPPDGGERT